MGTNSQGSILFIDNTQEISASNCELLSNQGYRILRAYTGQEGLEMLVAQKPVLVVANDMLPDMEGLEACAKIKSRAGFKPPLIILYSTLSRSTQERAQGLEAGAAAYLQEPLGRRELLAQIKALLQIREEDSRLGAKSYAQELSNTQQALNRNQKLLWDITSNLPGAVIQFEARKGEVPRPIFVSQGIKELLQLSPQEVLQDAKLLWANLHPEDAIQIYDRLFTSLEEGQPFEAEFRVITESHSVKWLRMSTAPYASEHKKQLYAIITDITQHKQKPESKTPKHLYDSLTNLPGYQLFMDRLLQSIGLAQRYENRLGLIFFDLEDFKAINNKYGRPVGDKLLHQTGQRILGCLRNSDTVARYGGDKFVVIANQVNQATGIHKVAEKIYMSMEDPFLLAGHLIQMKAHLGMGIFPDDAQNAEDLILLAMQNSYQAKSGS